MTPKERAAMQQALEALESYSKSDYIKKQHPKRRANGEKSITALREALAEQAEQEPVAQQDSDDKRLLREIFMLCEATEELGPTNDFMRGRIFEAKGIRRSIGTWYQDTFCGRSYMGEPVLNAAPVQQAEQEPVAWALSHSFGLEFSSKYPMQTTKEAAEQMARQHMGAVVVTPLYAAPHPVRTKDLTDTEILEISRKLQVAHGIDSFVHHARAVIAADREKNK